MKRPSDGEINYKVSAHVPGKGKRVAFFHAPPGATDLLMRAERIAASLGADATMIEYAEVR